LKICIYGTVFNNVRTIEESVESVWRPEHDIVIVDNYSTDGTWEKLLELRKDYNLKLYRYQCTRGLGRHIALYKCPENSTTAWFDLDTVYTPAYHKAIEYAVETKQVVNAGGLLIVRRELALGKGGWRDLNYGEDVEFVSKIGFHIHLPIVSGFNEIASAYMTKRERRYGGLKRVVKGTLDELRGSAPSIYRLIVSRSKRLAIFYVPARLLGFYRNRRPDNLTWIDLTTLTKAVPLREAGIDEKFFQFGATLTLINLVKGGEKAIDEKALSLVSGSLWKFRLKTRNVRVLYYNTPQLIDKSLIPLVVNVTVLK